MANGVRFASFGTDEIGLRDTGCTKILVEEQPRPPTALCMKPI